MEWSMGKKNFWQTPFCFTTICLFIMIIYDFVTDAISSHHYLFIYQVISSQTPSCLTTICLFARSLRHERHLVSPRSVYLPGNFVTDAILSYHLRPPASPDVWSHVTMAIWNSGGIRASFPAGRLQFMTYFFFGPHNIGLIVQCDW